MMCLTHGKKTEPMTPMNVDRGFEAVFRIRISFFADPDTGKHVNVDPDPDHRNVNGLLEI
jgi:hypothetical protein